MINKIRINIWYGGGNLSSLQDTWIIPVSLRSEPSHIIMTDIIFDAP